MLHQPCPQLANLERAKRPQRLPVVLTRAEVHAVLAQRTGTPALMAWLLSGAGLRLMACLRLRIQDGDFAYHQSTVRDGKGAQDRLTMLPQDLEEPLHRHLARVKLLHDEDVLAGYGEVYFTLCVGAEGAGGREGLALALCLSCRDALS